MSTQKRPIEVYGTQGWYLQVVKDVALLVCNREDVESWSALAYGNTSDQSFANQAFEAISRAVYVAQVQERARIHRMVKDSCEPGWGDRLAEVIASGGGCGERFAPVSEEREACAKLAESERFRFHQDQVECEKFFDGGGHTANMIAESIRARGSS